MLQDLVVDQAARHPDQPAIVLGPETVTYLQLDDLSARLAAVLVDRGINRGTRVCILLQKTPWAIIAILGVLKAGAIYVPLDPGGPVSRTSKMLRSCDDRWLITSSGYADLVSQLTSQPPSSGEWVVGWMDESVTPLNRIGGGFGLSEVLSTSARAYKNCGTPNDDAYIMFTSGSTGDPKGVRIKHRNVLGFLDWAIPYFRMGPQDRISSHPPLHFDLSVFDIFGAFAAGAQLCLVPQRLNLLAPALAQFIREASLTQWFSVPSVLNFIKHGDCVAHGDFPELDRLIWCGEVLPTRTLVYFMERLPHVQFTNLYGPTEATIASSYYTVPEIPRDQRKPVPIGTACAGEKLSILNNTLGAARTGEVGELFISGVGISPGYWRQEEETPPFVEVSIDGTTTRAYRTSDLAYMDERGITHYIGRTDTQIKSRGYRIELGEIEAALHALPALTDATVVALQSRRFDGWTICCAYVPASGTTTDPAVLTLALRTALPTYMIPQQWRQYENLPLNQNGKVNRTRLRADFEALLEDLE